jgi:glycosyltransferase involved in cell wall biosynthesis
LPRLIRKDDSLFIDAINAPFYDFILDHPLYHHDSLRRNLRDFHVFCLDENHKKYIEKYYPHVKSVYVIPLTGEEYLQPKGITERSDSTAADKNIDVLFTGTCVNPAEIMDIINKEPDFMKEDILFLINKLLTHNEMTQEDALEIRMKEADYIGEKNFSLFMQRYFLADTYAKAYTREKIIKLLVEAQIPVTVCGYGCDILFGTNQNAFTILKGIPFQDTFKLMSEAKILLNIMPLFKAGAHDRVFAGMLNKCVCLTDSSSYIEKNFKNLENIILFDLNYLEDVPSIITKLLENPTRMNVISEAGYKEAKEKHTWKNRVEEMLEAIQ